MRSSALTSGPVAWPLVPPPALQPAAATMVAATSVMTCLVGMIASSPLEPEDPDDAALAGVPPDVLVGVGRRAHVRGIVGADISREQEPVATNAGVDRYVLFSIRPAIGDRVAHDTGADLELGEQLAGLRVHGLEPPIERAIERHV